MMYKTSLHEAHAEIDRIYFDILPKHAMEVREGQIALCHTMLDAFADKNISLCHAGVGIGKTAAYLIAAVIWNKYQPDGLGGDDFSPFLIATSSIALQNAIIEDYIPRLSEILCAEGVIDEPFTGILRKGKGNYVCPRRLARRIETMNPEKRNKQKLDALLALRLDMDLGKASRMSQYDKERVAIPDTCPRKCEDADDCAFMRLHEAQQHSTALIQVCNHNYLLADALNQHRGYAPLLPAYRGLIVDEAHKLAAAARDMCRYRFDCGDAEEFLLELRKSVSVAPKGGSPLFESLFAEFTGKADMQTVYAHTTGRGELIGKCLEVLNRSAELCPNASGLRNAAQRIGRTLKRFYDADGRYLCYLEYDRDGKPAFVAVSRNVRTQLRTLFWNNKPCGMILASGTLAIDGGFQYAKRQLGLNRLERTVDESVIRSPFDYRQNCLLYLPENMPGTREVDAYREAASEQIGKLIEATRGHTLVLFTAYEDMSETYRLLKELDLPYPLFALNRKDEACLNAFRQSRNGVLLACGRAWEGMDFPGDIVSSLIMHKLPFPQKTLLSDSEKSQYMSLKDYLAAVVVPQMQVGVMQGIGRGVRLSTDTCVISILDHRAAPGSSYHRHVMKALPEMPATRSIDDVVAFIHEKKAPCYFEAEVADGCTDAE